MKRAAGLNSSKSKRARTAAPAEEIAPAPVDTGNANSEEVEVETSGSAVQDLLKLKEQANEAEDALAALDWCRGIIHESDRLLRNKGAAAQEDVIDTKDWAKVHAIYGWALQQFSDVPAELCKNEERAISRIQWLEQADEQYLLAFKLAAGNELPVAAHLEHALLCLRKYAAEEANEHSKAESTASIMQCNSRIVKCMSLYMLPDVDMSSASREEELETIAQMLPLLDEVPIIDMAKVAPHIMHFLFVVGQLGATESWKAQDMRGNIALACAGRYAEEVEEILAGFSEDSASVSNSDIGAGQRWAGEGRCSDDPSRMELIRCSAIEAFERSVQPNTQDRIHPKVGLRDRFPFILLTSRRSLKPTSCYTISLNLVRYKMIT